MRERLSTDRYPFETFMLVVCVISAPPLLVGHPTSIDAQVPQWAVFAWGAFLCLGAGIALTGIAWPERITGILLEQVGLVACGGAALFYALCIVLTVGLGGVGAAAIIGGFGAACLWQWVLLERLLARVRAEAKRRG